MTAHLTLSTKDLHRRINKEARHTLAVVAFTVGDGYGFGVVDGATGECLAWDGVYFGDVPATTSLSELDWDEWDDMASKYVLNAQREWLAGPLGFWLMPTYSVAHEAAVLVASNRDEYTDSETVGGAKVACYLPIYDHEAYEKHLAAEEAERQEFSDRLR